MNIVIAPKNPKNKTRAVTIDGKIVGNVMPGKDGSAICAYQGDAGIRTETVPGHAREQWFMEQHAEILAIREAKRAKPKKASRDNDEDDYYDDYED